MIHGSGDRAFEEHFAYAAQAHPNSIAVRLGYTEGLAHRIIAGCDLSLTPARFEPCGLTTMYGMRYGALPVTRAVGGIVDTVDDAGVVNADNDVGTGFLFDKAAPDDMVSSLLRATSWYQDSAAWKRLQRRAMKRNFAWEQSAQQYLALYNSVVGVIAPNERLPGDCS